MKTRYFTRENITATAETMLGEVSHLQCGRVVFAPDEAALLVLDMQCYFFDANAHAYIPSADAILPNLKRLVQVFCENNLPVVFTKHINTKENAGSMSRWWHDLILAENPLAEIHSGLDTSSGVVIEKTQYDAFYRTDLTDYLRECHVRQVVVAGVMTHLCCETTARSAFVQGFDVFFLVDGTATYHEDFHRATLLNLAHGFAKPVLSDEIVRAVKAQGA
ncbi:MAG: isochorismatase family protein [Anaerolineales bacterium]|nr:isochorismatase family protein [Anaerolineales bacterium]